jgi:hypothetical protein
MPKMKMSTSCKMSMAEEFGFKSSELGQIETFMNQQNQKTAKDILDSLVQDKKLSNKQKIVIAYVVGNSAREAAIQEELQKGMRIDTSYGVPPIGG